MIKQKKYAIIYTWPGGCQNAESEVIRHMLIAAKNMNITMDIVSKDGFILDDSFKKTNQKIHESEYEFMITMHYEDSKLLDAFYYHTLWNPPCIPLQYASYPDILKNIISNDDFLIYDDGGISQHLKAMLIDTPRNLDNASSLTASFPATMAMEPKLENPTLFYCGINWEKMIGTTTRHEELFKLLDRLENVKIYGPQKTWVGHKSYCGTIPFDGFSLVEEAHKCGVVLALSSDFHYRAGAATNRVYEGCAAGAIVISDTNRFIKKHFGDSILYIDFDKANPQHMCEQIKAHLDWIKNNKDDALKLAKKSQNIFLEKFTLEKQLTDIIANHENRKKAVADMLYAKNEKSVTLATLFLDSLTFGEHEQELLNNSIHNIERQIDKSITLAICCDKKTESDIQKHIKSLNTPVNVNTYAFAIFDDMNYKWVSRGQMLFDVIQRVPHDYLCVLDGHEIMFRDHITTLKRALEDNPEKPVAYSGCFFESQTGERCVTLNKRILNKDIYDCVWPNNASNPGGAFLIDKKIENYLTDYICAYLDGTEVSAMLNIALFKHDKSFIYSKRTTCGSYKKPAPDYASVIDRAKQINLIHGLVTFDSSEIDYKQEAPVIFNESCIKTILSANRLRLKYRIIVLRLRNLFILKKSRRKRNKERIKKYKAQMRVTNLV